ncbi:carboxypeptidase-like regulatory domain-containing protein [Ornithinimicrobium cryptoxanthini]|uniref:Carboxypeptidase-like regulatory domain-containing protein n=1 Tax=Ornithinimicrobium cryptoxanthini TaxID=2934161 RepID=A0ABY4YIT1_9MICO|nr:carboxypeptidase-like regulatory domain-containing protein [Ornithinimicrobium cryptoxanthini]USQ76519.1 carboxypeptidase-like regulatory domain-containing protein [Ornithinimicrobium cryptoxanthini]
MTQRTWRSGASLLLAATLLTACTGGPPEVSEPPRPSASVDGTAGAPSADQGAGGEAGGQVGEPVAAEVALGEVEPYVVKGRVLDPQGRPMPGVSVLADNTMLYDSNAQAVTDADGAYRLDLSLMETTWRMYGQHEVDYDGQRFTFRLEVDESPFASSEGAIRDFVWRIGGPMGDGVLFHGGGGHVYQDYGTYGIEDITLVTLHFTPSAPLVDGTAGEPVDVPVDVMGAFGGVPLGRYTITATYGPVGAEQDLLIREDTWDDDVPYAPSVEAGFEPDLWGGDLAVQVRLPD